MSVSVDIEKQLGSFLLKVRFEAENETLALLGASGCGKTMTLKCIAGVEKPDRGRIVVDGVTLFDSEKKIDLPPQARHVGLLFQNYALFPNMTVLQNIRAGARREKDKGKREVSVRRIMERFGLESLSGHYPHQLSGGQQQRVALARILVSDPGILLLDEPFSALDSYLRFQLEQQVRDVIRSFGKTVLLVSHDRDEVYRMADSLAVMHGGRITACGKKKDIFAAPVTRTGALLTGCRNLSKAVPLGNDRVFAADWGIELSVSGQTQDTGCVGIRMQDLLPGRGENSILFDVTEVIENPDTVTVMLRSADMADAVCIGWETDKENWKQYQSEQLYMKLPKNRILLLKEDQNAE